jgi:hypothetical protein
MTNYETLVDATNDLMQRGYTANLNFEDGADTIEDKTNNIHIGPDDFEIDEFHRFEGPSNPSDMSIVYAISSAKYNLKGILVDAYGVYSNNSQSQIEAKLHHGQVSDKLHGSDRPTE